MSSNSRQTSCFEFQSRHRLKVPPWNLAKIEKNASIMFRCSIERRLCQYRFSRNLPVARAEVELGESEGGSLISFDNIDAALAILMVDFSNFPQSSNVRRSHNGSLNTISFVSPPPKKNLWISLSQIRTSTKSRTYANLDVRNLVVYLLFVCNNCRSVRQSYIILKRHFRRKFGLIPNSIMLELSEWQSNISLTL